MKIKRILSLLLVLALCLACVPVSVAEEGNPYAGLDTSKHVDLIMYLLGDKSDDAAFDEVMVLVNEKLEKTINASLTLELLGLSDFATRYPLILSSGEQVDIIYTADWCFFSENARKGAFTELTDDFFKTYMPQTAQNQSEKSLKQQRTADGKLYALPRNQSDYEEGYGVAIRGDLRKKYGMDELKTYADYETYLLKVAENEKDIYGLYNMPSYQAGVLSMYNQYYNIHYISSFNCGFGWPGDGSFSVDEVEFRFITDSYREYALRMAKYAKAGVWPSNAIANTVHPDDMFKEGRSATDFINYNGLNSLIINGEQKGMEVEVYDIFPDMNTLKTAYIGDALAIPVASIDPERAAMALDLLKNDREINQWLMGGIEGRHYILDESDNTHSNGPEAASYPWDSFTWSLRNDWMPKAKLNPSVEAIRAGYDAKLTGDYWNCDGFAFDDTDVRAEWAVIQSIISEYEYSFDLGIYGDETEAKLDEMKTKLFDAGLQKVMDAFLAQVAEFVK